MTDVPYVELALTMRNRLLDLAKKATNWAWLVCDQTVACPSCGVAWWDTEGDLADDWHAPDCEFQQILVELDLSTGKKVTQGVQAYDKFLRPDLEKIASMKAKADANEVIAQVTLPEALEEIEALNKLVVRLEAAMP